jgi:uncharacterized alkaline shock family protein YloU
MRLRRRRGHGTEPGGQDTERTVVRPTFSSLGNYSISDEAMRMMIEIILRRIRGVDSLLYFTADNEIAGVVFNMELSLIYGFNAPQVLRDVQERVSQLVEEYTSINVISVNVKACRVVHASMPPGDLVSESRK